MIVSLSSSPLSPCLVEHLSSAVAFNVSRLGKIWYFGERHKEKRILKLSTFSPSTCVRIFIACQRRHWEVCFKVPHFELFARSFCCFLFYLFSCYFTHSSVNKYGGKSQIKGTKLVPIQLSSSYAQKTFQGLGYISGSEIRFFLRFSEQNFFRLPFCWQTSHLPPSSGSSQSYTWKCTGCPRAKYRPDSDASQVYLSCHNLTWRCHW